MTEFSCEIAESRIKPFDTPPVLSFFVPTFNRVPEMVETIENLAGQLHGGLEDKVEILISDNASGAEGREAIRALADRFPNVSYMSNAADQGGWFQIYSAPWRVRGAFTWILGSDDKVAPGGIGHVVSRLESDNPDFLTMDKQIWNRDLTQQLYATANGLPERTFQGFIALFKGVGLHQIGYLGASVERTEKARNIDAFKYITAETMHSYAIAYFEKHQHSKCLYLPQPHVIRRLGNSGIVDYMGVVLTDIGLYFPIILSRLAAPYGFTDDIFDQVPGSRFIDTFDPPKLTLVDNIFEYQIKSIARGKGLWFSQRVAFERMSLSWRPHRRKQFEEIWAISEKARVATEAISDARLRYEALVADAAGYRAELNALAMTFSDKKPV